MYGTCMNTQCLYNIRVSFSQSDCNMNLHQVHIYIMKSTKVQILGAKAELHVREAMRKRTP